MVKVEAIKIKLPHPFWQIQIYDPRHSNFFPLHGEAICEPYKLISNEQLINCDTYIQLMIESLDTIFIRLTYDEAHSVELLPSSALVGTSIENNYIMLTLESFSDVLAFKVITRKGEETLIFSFVDYLSKERST